MDTIHSARHVTQHDAYIHQSEDLKQLFHTSRERVTLNRGQKISRNPHTLGQLPLAQSRCPTQGFQMLRKLLWKLKWIVHICQISPKYDKLKNKAKALSHHNAISHWKLSSKFK